MSSNGQQKDEVLEEKTFTASGRVTLTGAVFTVMATSAEEAQEKIDANLWGGVTWDKAHIVEWDVTGKPEQAQQDDGR